MAPKTPRKKKTVKEWAEVLTKNPGKRTSQNFKNLSEAEVQAITLLIVSKEEEMKELSDVNTVEHFDEKVAAEEIGASGDDEAEYNFDSESGGEEPSDDDDDDEAGDLVVEEGEEDDRELSEIDEKNKAILTQMLKEHIEEGGTTESFIATQEKLPHDPEDKKKAEVKKDAPSKLFSTASTTATTKSKATLMSYSLDSVISNITDFTYDDYQNTFDDFEYEGFDPIYTIRRLGALCEEAKGDQGTFLKDMQFLVGIIVLRGTNKTNLVEKTNILVRDQVTAMLTKYKVDDGTDVKSKKSMDKDKILLSRIISCFPMYACMSIAIGGVKPKCDTTGLDSFLHHTAGPSMIPATDKSLYAKWLEWSVKFDKLINGKNADEEKCDFFGQIAWNSTIVPDEKRPDLLKKLRLAVTKKSVTI